MPARIQPLPAELVSRYSLEECDRIFREDVVESEKFFQKIQKWVQKDEQNHGTRDRQAAADQPAGRVRAAGARRHTRSAAGSRAPMDRDARGV